MIIGALYYVGVVGVPMVAARAWRGFQPAQYVVNYFISQLILAVGIAAWQTSVWQRQRERGSGDIGRRSLDLPGPRS